MLRLHGSSVELAIVHREGPRQDLQQEPGLDFVARIKQDPSQSDLPLIITSEKWIENECAAHQRTPFGANAYLHYPFNELELARIIDAVLGTALAEEAASPAPTLEDVSGIFNQSAPAQPSEGGISLELPSQSLMTDSGVELETSPPVEISIPTAEVHGEPAIIELALSGPQVPEAGSEAIETFQGNNEISLPEPTYEQQSPAAPAPGPDEDDLIAREMPYLLGGTKSESRSGISASPMQVVHPVGDAVVPGGAAHSPDLETLKKYLFLREQDVGALSTQLKGVREQLVAVEDLLRIERAKNVELEHVVNEQRRKVEDFEKQKSFELESFQSEVKELRFELKSKMDKARVLESGMRAATEEMERLKERVRVDIRKIRVREKELENRLEIMKKDSEALISARENKIIDLKRKLDLVEFNMDLLQDQYAREKEISAQLREKLGKAAQVVRVAGGLLTSDSEAEQKEAGKAVS